MIPTYTQSDDEKIPALKGSEHPALMEDYAAFSQPPAWVNAQEHALTPLQIELLQYDAMVREGTMLELDVVSEVYLTCTSMHIRFLALPAIWLSLLVGRQRKVEVYAQCCACTAPKYGTITQACAGI